MSAVSHAARQSVVFLAGLALARCKGWSRLKAGLPVVLNFIASVFIEDMGVSNPLHLFYRFGPIMRFAIIPVGFFPFGKGLQRGFHEIGLRSLKVRILDDSRRHEDDEIGFVPLFFVLAKGETDTGKIAEYR